jgi:hypothetical protein
MSALGQNRTFAVQKTMSALPPKADIAPDWANGQKPAPPQALSFLDFATAQAQSFAYAPSEPSRPDWWYFRYCNGGRRGLRDRPNALDGDRSRLPPNGS